MAPDVSPDPSDFVSSEQPTDPPQKVLRNKSRHRIREWVRFCLVVVIAACLGGIVYVRSRAAAGDFATVNIVTLILSFFALLALLARVLLRSDIPLPTRLIRVGVVVVPLCVLASMSRIDHVSGSLVPVFRWRWTPRPDELLPAPQVADNSKKVDLVTTTPIDFPQFLGPHRDLYLSDVLLNRDWKASPPREVWRHPIGAGWSGFSVVNGYAVTMEQRGPDELVTCSAVESGQALWSHGETTRHATLAGGIGPRCTPTIDEGLVYALGATGILRCLDGANGNLLWRDDILQRGGVAVEQESKGISWGRSASPLIVDDLVVVPLGGPAGGELFQSHCL